MDFGNLNIGKYNSHTERRKTATPQGQAKRGIAEVGQLIDIIKG